MDEVLKIIGAVIGLILVTLSVWVLYTGLIMIVLVGMFTIFDTTFQYFAIGTPFPDWWWIIGIFSAVVGAFEFYEKIVRNP